MDAMGRSKEPSVKGSKTAAADAMVRSAGTACGSGGAAGGRPSQPGASLGSDFLQLDVTDAPPGGRTAWLADRLRSAIADGRLPVGTRLPASRVLAEELRVTRGVVTEAYRRLSESGQIAGRGGGGTVVVAAPAPAASSSALPTASSASGRPSS
ncbi:winged helix-turn-helix domain-containing protein, partial [Streptomyces sp. ATE26]|uniref:winged helix-turn-helix domain-containing protein n=1 Tax=Streptomyces sp. ATE26 TaxID=2954237 RepID=UPI002482E9A0